MNEPSLLRMILLVAGLLLSSSRDAAAYIDPGGTSYFFQILIAGLTAMVFFFSSIKRRVAQFFRSLRGRREAETDSIPPDSAATRDL